MYSPGRQKEYGRHPKENAIPESGDRRPLHHNPGITSGYWNLDVVLSDPPILEV